MMKTPGEKIRDAIGEFDCYTVEYGRVDTDGRFVHEGRRYRIDNQVAQYKPIRTAVGLLYDMDKIIIVTTKSGNKTFFDMQYNEIAPENITRE